MSVLTLTVARDGKVLYSLFIQDNCLLFTSTFFFLKINYVWEVAQTKLGKATFDAFVDGHVPIAPSQASIPQPDKCKDVLPDDLRFIWWPNFYLMTYLIKIIRSACDW